MRTLIVVIFLLITSCAMEQPRKMLALGDSYTIGESVAERERWPVQLADTLRKRGLSFESPVIIATTGWRTDDLKAGIAKANPGNDFDYVSLLIGVNNQYQGKPIDVYRGEFEELLNMAVGFAGGDKSKVFVLSIPDYGYTPFGEPKQPQISSEIDAFNAANAEITAANGITYIDITPISRKGFEDPSLVASDGLHPSGKMYRKWVDAVLEKVKFR